MSSRDDSVRCMHSGDYTFRFACGFNKPISAITLETRQDFVTSITLHYCVFSVYAEISQLRLGLCDTLDMKELVKNYPVEFWSLPAANSVDKNTVQSLQDLFEVVYHPRGHNDHPSEERAILFLYDYLQECKGMYVCNIKRFAPN